MWPGVIKEKLGFSGLYMVTACSLGQVATFSRIRRTGAHVLSIAYMINITDGALLTLSPEFPICNTILSHGLFTELWAHGSSMACMISGP